MMWLWLACTGEKPNYGDFTSRDGIDVTEPTSEPTSETGTIDTAEDTGDLTTTHNQVMFRAPLMNCTEIQKRTMTLTRMFPGGLDVDGASQAEFFDEIARFPLGDSNLAFEQTEGLNDCIFAIELPEPSESDLQEVMLLEEGDLVEVGVQWAFYYPATFVHSVVDCQTLALTEGNTQKVSCQAAYSTAQTPSTQSSSMDEAVWAGDIYDWGSDVMPVYIQGDVQGAFGDLGFELGWNLAKFSEGEIVLVEPLSKLDQLERIVLDNRSFLPRYKVNGRGSVSAEADFGLSYSIGLVSGQWLNQNTSVSSGTSMYVQDSAVSWSMEIWGEPSEEQFLSNGFVAGNVFYEQWRSEVDVAAFVPVVYSGTPTAYNSGIPVLGTDIQETDTRMGAVCKDSSTLAFLFYQAPRRPSEIYWYDLIGKHPGWYAYYGTHGDVSTWRGVLENSDLSTPFNYMSLTIGNSCKVPTAWQ